MLAAAVFFPMKTEAISARRAYVLDAVSGRVLFEKNPREQSLIASTTKIMTALIVCEQCNVLDRMRIPKEAVGMEGSSMYLKEGEILTLQEIKDALCYLRMATAADDLAFRRIITQPKRGIGNKTLDTNEKAAGDKQASM